jgi:hypothetical protein
VQKQQCLDVFQMVPAAGTLRERDFTSTFLKRFTKWGTERGLPIALLPLPAKNRGSITSF